MVIVSGHLLIAPGRREAFLAASRPAIVAARQTDGCLAFVVAPDPIEVDRVVVYEAWTTEGALEAFRGAGPEGGLFDDVVAADVKRHQVSASGPA